MQRAALERQRTLNEWRRRLKIDADLPPGRFRKGRTARGCPHRCAHCAALREKPSRRYQLAQIAWREQLVEL
jgi:radical SAM superfamily enzyme YgiQ (UPF0313 family)